VYFYKLVIGVEKGRGVNWVKNFQAHLSLTTTPAYTKFNFHPGSAPSANRIVTSAYIVHVIVQD